MLGKRSLLAVASIATHILTSSHNFIYQQELLGEYGRNIKELSLHDVVVPHG